jgi:hypothetical protein
MSPIDLSRLSPQERRTYKQGMKIVSEKLYQARLTKPTAEEIHKRSLSMGISEIRSRLAKIRGTEKRTPLVPSRKCYSKNGRKTLSTGGINPYLRNGRHCICTGSII